MNDPTYNRDAINKNPVWLVAFVLSEIKNDNAPIGWSAYIQDATVIVDDLKKHKHLKATQTK